MADRVINPVYVGRYAASALASQGAALAAGDRFVVPNDGRTMLRLEALAAGPVSARIESTITVDGLSVDDRSYALLASAIAFVGGFPVDIYGGRLIVEASAAGRLKIQAFRLSV